MDGSLRYQITHLVNPLVIVSLFGLYLVSLYSFLLFHSLVELFSILVAFSIFIISWNARRFLDGNYLGLLGVAYLFVGGIDLLHTLSYKGMGVFQGNNANLPTQLWIAARYMQSLSLLAVPLLIRKKIDLDRAFALYLVGSSVLIASIFCGVFPDCFIEGVGLTPFKKVSEYIISLILFVSMVLTVGNRSEFERPVWILLTSSIALTIASELAFTFYVSVYGLSNLVGHFLKFLAFYFIYKAITEKSLINPYDTLFRNLKHSEERYRALVEVSPEAVFINRNGRFAFANPAAVTLLGFSGSEQLLGKPVLEIFHPDYHRVIRERIEHLNQGRAVPLIEEKVVRTDGKSVDVEVAACSFIDQEGPVIQVILRDITERKRAEEELQQQREWLRVTLTSIGDAVMATDTSGRITFLNPVAERLTGWQLEEALGQPVRNVFRIINEKTHRPAEDIVGRVLREGYAVALANHTALVTRDERVIPIEDSAAPIKDSTGNVVGVVLVFYDVSEKRRAEQELRNVNRTLRALSNVNRAMIQAENESDLMNEVCRIVVEDCGHPLVWIGFAEEDKDKSVRPVAQAGFEEGYLDTINITWADTERGSGPTGTAVRTGTMNACQNMLTDPRMQPWRDQAIMRGYSSSIALPLQIEGKTFGALTIYARKPDPFAGAEVKLLAELAGDLAYGIAAIRLRQAHQRMEEELRRSRDGLELRVRERTAELALTNKALREYATRLERLNQELEEFAFIAAHDLQEPLRKIQTFGDRLDRMCGGSLSRDQQDCLERMIRSAARMASLVRSLASYSQIMRKANPRQPTDLARVVAEAISDLEAAVKGAEGHIEVGELPTIEADGVQLRQLFLNLISNSMQYAKENERPVVKITGEVTQGICQIRVEDNGIGFEEHYLDRVFRPFQRLHGRSGPYEGTGMGLTICRKIVEMHGGTITARSTPSRGATFIINLPVSQ